MNAKLIASLGLAAVLTACGGGGGGDDTAPPPQSAQVPDSAMVSTKSMTDFIKTMREDEGSEPLTMSPVQSPVSDTEEPVPGG
jgi:hypothetical protein